MAAQLNLAATLELDTKRFESGVKSAMADVKRLGAVIRELNQSLKNGLGAGKASSELGKLSGELRRTRSQSKLTRTEIRQMDDLVLKTWASTRGWRATWAATGQTIRFSTRAITDAIGQFIDFDDQVRAAAALTGDFENAFDRFSEAAKRIGEITRFTAGQAAQALRYLAMAGLDVDTAIGALPATLQLAQAANIGLGRAADIVTNVMSQYRIQIDGLNRANDVLVSTFSNSNTSLSELANAFVYTGSIAKASNQSFEQTNALLGILANNGYKGTKAGRTLMNALADLQIPTKKAYKAMQEYSVATRDSTGEMRPLTDILEEFKNKVIEQKGAAAVASETFRAFGKIAGPGLVAILGTGTDAVKQLENQLYGLSKAASGELLANLRNESSGVTKALNAIGVSAYGAQGGLKNLPQLLADIVNAGGGEDAIRSIFPPETADLAVQALQNGANSTQTFQNQLATLRDTAAQTAQNMEGGIGGAARLLKSSWEAVKIAIGEALNVDVITVFQRLTEELKTNRAAIAETVRSIVSVVLQLATWATQLIGFVADNKAAVLALGVFALALTAIKFQIIELSSVMLGKLVASFLASGTAATGAAGATGRLTFSLTALNGAFAQGMVRAGGFFSVLTGGAVAATTATRVLTATLTTLLIPLAALWGLTKIVELYFAWRDANKATEESEKRLADAIKRSNDEAAKREQAGQTIQNAAQLNVSAIDEMKTSLIKSISDIERAQADANATFGDGFFTLFHSGELVKLQKYKADLRQVNAIMRDPAFIERSQQMDALSARADVYRQRIENNNQQMQNSEQMMVEHSELLSKRQAEAKMTEHERALESALYSAEEALKVEEDYAQKVIDLSRQIQFEKLSDEQKIREMRRSMMSEAGQESDKQKEIQESLAAARQAEADGDRELALKLADSAKSQAASLKNKLVGIKEFEAAAQLRNELQAKELSDLQAVRDEAAELSKQSPVVQLQAETDEAKQKIAEIEAAIAQLDGKSATVKVNTETTAQRNAGGFIGWAENAAKSVQYFARGDFVPGVGNKDTVPAMLTPKEFVVTARDNRSTMAAGILRFINSAPIAAVKNFLQNIPQLNVGGFVSMPDIPVLQPVVHMNAGGSVAPAPAPQVISRRLDWNIGGQRGTLLGEADQLDQLADAIENQMRGMR